MRQRVAAVGVSGQGAGAIRNRWPRSHFAACYSLAGSPLCFWMPNSCSRAAGLEIVEISGKLPASYNLELKLRWVKTHEPEDLGPRVKALTATSFITYRLTGNPVMNHSDGGISLAYESIRAAMVERTVEPDGTAAVRILRPC